MKDIDLIVSLSLKDTPVAAHLEELGLAIKYMSLRRGEAVLAPEVGLKHFTHGSFLKGLKDRSLYREIIELKREYDRPVIIIEGSEPWPAGGAELTSVQMALSFVAVLNRIPVLCSRNPAETAQLIFFMNAQIGSGFDLAAALRNAALPIVEPETPSASNGDRRQMLIEQIPEVGPTLAKALLDHFGSLAGLFTAGIDDLRKVSGVGPKRAQAIHAFLNAASSTPSPKANQPV